MPKTRRFKKTLKGRKYDLSEGQLLILTKASFRITLPIGWPVQQQVNSLLRQGLISKDGSTARTMKFVRTNKGLNLYTAIKANLKSSTT